MPRDHPKALWEIFATEAREAAVMAQTIREAVDAEIEALVTGKIKTGQIIAIERDKRAVGSAITYALNVRDAADRYTVTCTDRRRKHRTLWQFDIAPV